MKAHLARRARRELGSWGATGLLATLLASAGLLACAPQHRIPVIVTPLNGVSDDAGSAGEAGTPSPSQLTYGPALGGPPANAAALAGEGFEAIGEEHGIKIYRRSRDSGMELAAEGRLSGSPERVQRVLTDYPAHRRWQKHLKDLRILGRGDAFIDVYERLELPVIDDRDYVVHVTWGSEGDVRWVGFATVIAGGPPKVDGVVRITAHSGSWRLQPEGGGARTYAVYRFHIDVAGSVPSWLGAGQAKSDIAEFFEKIDHELPRYP